MNNGFLNIVKKGDTLPFQSDNANFDWNDKMVVFDYLPTFFSKQFSFGNDITEIKIHKLDRNLVKQSENYTDLVNAITNTITLSSPETFIEKIVKANNNIIYKSFYGAKLATDLSQGLYFLEFTDGIKELMTDVFCVSSISHDIVGIIQNVLNSWQITSNIVLDNSGNEINGKLYTATCLECTISTILNFIDNATITNIQHSGTAILAFSGPQIFVMKAGTIYDLIVTTLTDNRHYPCCEKNNGVWNILHNVNVGNSETHILFENATWGVQNEYFRLYFFDFDIIENISETDTIIIPRKNNGVSNIIT